MRAYIIMVVGAALMSAFADLFAPENWRKYVKIATGLVILAVLLTPLIRLKDIDLFSGFFAQTQNTEEYERQYSSGIEKQLEENVEKDAAERIASEFDTDARVSAEIDTTADGKIKGVRRIYVHASKNETGIQRRLAEVYGVDESEVIVGR